MRDFLDAFEYKKITLHFLTMHAVKYRQLIPFLPCMIKYFKSLTGSLFLQLELFWHWWFWRLSHFWANLSSSRKSVKFLHKENCSTNWIWGLQLLCRKHNNFAQHQVVYNIWLMLLWLMWFGAMANAFQVSKETVH